MTPYGHHWRTVERPQTLARNYWECVRCGIGDRPMGLRSALDVAHLNGNNLDGDEANRATLCRTCHRATDYESWSAKYRAWLADERERRLDRLDAERPILNYTRWQEFLGGYGLVEVEDACAP